jgi:hypothetical protein
MQRDMDLIRDILMTVGSPSWPAPGCRESLFPEGRDRAEVEYHLKLAVEAGLLEGEVTRSSGSGYHTFVEGLTWRGHDFLDAARTEFIWDEVKDEIKAKGLASASFEVLKRLLDKAIRKRLDDLG